MEQGNLYEAIYKRKSVRRYDLEPLNLSLLEEISSYMQSIPPFFPEIKTEMRIFEQADVRILLPIKAPHFLLFYSENKDGYLMNAGYMLEQLDLYLSSRGIGSCYLGMAQPKKNAKKSSSLECVMILAFGIPVEPAHRSSLSEFKRKSLPQITDIQDNGPLLEAVRLSPSATNSQPWFFTGNPYILHAYCIKLNLIKAAAYEKMNKIDMGIAICHLELAARHLGKTVTYSFEGNAKNLAPEGYYYVISIHINESPPANMV
ncbi:MAG: nitroreductase [Eubacteriaceae bacterium]|nr:nitroreductase [Eubacteriaceae bacterium]